MAKGVCLIAQAPLVFKRNYNRNKKIVRSGVCLIRPGAAGFQKKLPYNRNNKNRGGVGKNIPPPRCARCIPLVCPRMPGAGAAGGAGVVGAAGAAGEAGEAGEV